MLLRSTIFAVAVAIVGCSDPKAANEDNFKVSIQAYLDTAYPKCYLYTELPTTIGDFDLNRIKEKLQALAKAGIVSKKEGSREISDYFSRVKKTVPAPLFDLTDEGRKYYKPDIEKTLGGKSVGGFCFGKARIKEITQFTEPADLFGQKVSSVNYTYEVYDLPEWAKSPEIISAIDSLKSDVESLTTPVKKMEAVILTNNGWVHEKILKRAGG
ncbi:hypothetical protein [Methylobacter sp.]|uniref:hypothetical protein n=1 Tax=Methylobacter sp. TaxID=2051955 RepID=UPI002FDE9676